MIRWRAPACAIILWAMAGTSMADEAQATAFVQPRDAQGRFVNLDGRSVRGAFTDFLRWRLGPRTRAPDRAAIPVVEPDLRLLATPPARGEGVRITWIGHATFLVQLDGKTLITDPILGDVWPGFVRRNVRPGIAPEALPHIDAVLVTHDHYDHLDVPTLKRIGAPIIAGLGTRKLLARQGLHVTELAWWSKAYVGDVDITFVPAHHFAKRGLADDNRRLWGGFVIEGRSATVYHAGDTALFQGFREIGRRFPGIDVALLPIGAYDPAWFMERVHLSPETALAAFAALGARTFVAMHWGTFKLTDEPLDEPPRRLDAERKRLGLDPARVRVLAVGESIQARAGAARPLESASP